MKFNKFLFIALSYIFIPIFTYSQQGCTDEIACNYNENATDNDGSCIFPSIENNIQCEECCNYSNGTWVHYNAFNLCNNDTPTILAESDDLSWSLTESSYINSEENEDENGSIITTSYFSGGTLTSNCFVGQVDISISFNQSEVESEDESNIIILISDISSDLSFSFITTNIEYNELACELSGEIQGGFSGLLIELDDDGDGINNCDERV